MKPNPAFHFLQTLSPIERGRFILKRTKKKKAAKGHSQAEIKSAPAAASAATEEKQTEYFLDPLDAPKGKYFTINGTGYKVVEQHISIFKLYDDRKKFITALHFTATLRAENGQELLLHSFYDQAGVFKELRVTNKNNATEIVLSETERLSLRNYAGLQSAEAINDLNQKITVKREQLLAAIYENETAMRAIKDLPQAQPLKRYIAIVKKTIPLITAFNEISNNALTKKHKYFQHALTSCRQKLQAGSTKTSKPTIPTKISKPSPAAAEEKEEKTAVAEDKLPAPDDTQIQLSKINAELETLKETDENYFYRAQELLERKFQCIPEDDFEKQIETFQRLNVLGPKVQDFLFKRALAGDLRATEEIIKANHFIDRGFYANLVAANQLEVFKRIYAHAPIALNFSVFFHPPKPKEDRAFPIDEAPPFTHIPIRPATVFYIAYALQLYEFFKFLLEISYAITHDPAGISLMHFIAHNNDIRYAELMAATGADVNPLPENKILLVQETVVNKQKVPSQQLQEARALMDEYKKLVADYSLDPLQEAIRCGHLEMVRWLLAHGADPQQRRSALNCSAMGRATYSHFWGRTLKTLRPEIILLLAEQKLSVDEKYGPPGRELTGLYYACNYNNLEAVQTLVMCFAANPNLTVNQQIKLKSSKSAEIRFADISSFNRAADDGNWPLVQFFLNQDMVAITADTLAQSLDPSLRTKKYLTPSGNEMALIENAIRASQKKLQHLTNAETAAVANDHKRCVHECEQALAINTLQNNEKLFKLAYRAYLAMKDFAKAGQYYEKYLQLLRDKHKQILIPFMKELLQKRIALAEKDRVEISLQGKPAAAAIKEGVGSKQVMQALQAEFKADKDQASAITEDELATAALKQHSDSPFAKPVVADVDGSACTAKTVVAGVPQGPY